MLDAFRCCSTTLFALRISKKYFKKQHITEGLTRLKKKDASGVGVIQRKVFQQCDLIRSLVFCRRFVIYQNNKNPIFVWCFLANLLLHLWWCLHKQDRKPLTITGLSLALLLRCWSKLVSFPLVGHLQTKYSRSMAAVFPYACQKVNQLIFSKIKWIKAEVWCSLNVVYRGGSHVYTKGHHEGTVCNKIFQCKQTLVFINCMQLARHFALKHHLS